MIIYTASKKGFIDDVHSNQIETKIYEVFQEHLGRTSKNEIRSWQNSMMYMSNILIDANIPEDSNVAIEYQIPNTSKRVDFIISGLDGNKEESVVIVELKQWESAKKTHKDGIVLSYVGGAERELNHPSHQAYTYAKLIQEFNETVQDDNIHVYPCTYLHNYKHESFGIELLDEWYQEYLDKAPAFLREDTTQLKDFIKKYIKYGDDKDILYRIDHGRIKPSKSLAESVGNLLKGNKEFEMIDDQKVVYEAIMDLVVNNEHNQKRTIIVKGGPGTGKSVIAINLLGKLINQQINAQYVSKNSAPRQVYSSLLKGSFKKSFIDNLFRGSGSYMSSNANIFECLIADEAHRLNEKSGFYGNQGNNQIVEIINAATVSVFFIDEDQIVTLKDIGEIDHIKECANELNAEVYEMELTSQFRCNGSDGYLAWLDNMLGIRDTANYTLSQNEFDFKVFDDPHELRREILKKNMINNKARILAGYCWDWPTKHRNDTHYHDIQLPKYNFSMSWNLNLYGKKYIIAEESVYEAGCIHTAQGLELDYVGVIVGKDLRLVHGDVITDVDKRSKNDVSVRGWKTKVKQGDKEVMARVDRIIRNTYKVLMTRGMKGCYVFFEDDSLRDYFNKFIK
jgi:hypothetical protein